MYVSVHRLCLALGKYSKNVISLVTQGELRGSE